MELPKIYQDNVDFIRARKGDEAAEALIKEYIEQIEFSRWALGYAPANYEDYIKSEGWKIKADDAKARAGYRCQVCNGQDRLEAHHRTYENLGYERNSDITVLCHDCHELFSKNGKLKR